MVDAEAVTAALARIAGAAVRTPALSFPAIDKLLPEGVSAVFKAEHMQRTGSFKVRGSANFVHALDAAEAALGVVTASSGNHGIGVATAAARISGAW